MLKAIGVGPKSDTALGVHFDFVPDVFQPRVRVSKIHGVGLVAGKSQAYVDRVTHRWWFLSASIITGVPSSVISHHTMSALPRKSPQLTTRLPDTWTTIVPVTLSAGRRVKRVAHGGSSEREKRSRAVTVGKRSNRWRAPEGRHRFFLGRSANAPRRPSAERLGILPLLTHGAAVG